MPGPEEVQAALDVLWASKNINHEFETRMWMDRKSKLDYQSISMFQKAKGRLPSRPVPGCAKQDFDDTFRPLVTLALEQAERVRKEKKGAIDVQIPTANIVIIQPDQYGVELYLGKAGNHLVDGFSSPPLARRWATYESEAYLREKGLPAGTKLLIIGDDYY